MNRKHRSLNRIKVKVRSSPMLGNLGTYKGLERKAL